MILILLIAGLLYRPPMTAGQTPAQDDAQPSAVPKFDYHGADGCGDLFVHTWSADRKEVLRVGWNVWRVLKTSRPGTVGGNFDLSRRPPKSADLDVAVDVYPSSDYGMYCTDVLWGLERRVVWQAVAGHLTIEPDKDAALQRMPTFAVTVTLKDAIFRAPDGREARPRHPIIVKTRAGRPVGG